MVNPYYVHKNKPILHNDKCIANGSHLLPNGKQSSKKLCKSMYEESMYVHGKEIMDLFTTD